MLPPPPRHTLFPYTTLFRSNYGRRGRGKKFLEGMTVAIEPMINMGTRRVKQLSDGWTDRKSTRLNSSHVRISYAVFCLKKKNSVYCTDFARPLQAAKTPAPS